MASPAIGKPMFNNQRPPFETHLFDFDEDIYGQTISVALVAHIRGQEVFTGLDELIVAMDRDSRKARELIAQPGPLTELDSTTGLLWLQRIASSIEHSRTSSACRRTPVLSKFSVSGSAPWPPICHGCAADLRRRFARFPRPESPPPASGRSDGAIVRPTCSIRASGSVTKIIASCWSKPGHQLLLGNGRHSQRHGLRAALRVTCSAAPLTVTMPRSALAIARSSAAESAGFAAAELPPRT